MDALWAGRVADVLTELERHRAGGEAVSSTHTYFTNQQGRMRYPDYRARGLSMGSGTVESGCKQVVSSRLKGAGMIRRADGARQGAKVRVWLKGGRRQEAMALRAAPQRRQRSCRGDTTRQETGDATAAAPVMKPSGAARAPAPLPQEVLATILSELAQKPARHLWRQAWSRKQQRVTNIAAADRPALVSSP